MKRGISVLLACIMLVGTISVVPSAAQAATKEQTISVGAFAKKLQKVTKAKESDLFLKGEFKDKKKAINNGEAALLVNRADEAKNGTAYSKKLYQQVKEKYRITGILKLGEKKQDAIRKCFVKGIMIGYSNGEYSQNREFHPSYKLTIPEAHKILLRLENKKKRVKLSPDGQVTRTTNLPKNYKSYSYILASFPNSFYEKKFTYQVTKWNKKPKEFEDYTRPKNLRKDKLITYANKYKMSEVLDKYQDIWCKKVEDNLRLRLSFNYQTVTNEWMNDLRKTYIIYDDKEMDKSRPKNIRDYANIAKKNKVKMQVQQVVVEPSTMYAHHGFWVRVHVKFKLTSAKEFYSPNSLKQRNLIYGSEIYLQNWKKNQWYEGDFDIELTGNNMNDTGYGYGISDDTLSDWEE